MHKHALHQQVCKKINLTKCSVRTLIIQCWTKIVLKIRVRNHHVWIFAKDNVQSLNTTGSFTSHIMLFDLGRIIWWILSDKIIQTLSVTCRNLRHISVNKDVYISLVWWHTMAWPSNMTHLLIALMCMTFTWHKFQMQASLISTRSIMQESNQLMMCKSICGIL